MNVSRYIKIALFFIVLGGAGIIYIIMASSGINQFNISIYEVYLSDATGLSTRSRIYLAGVPVGKVEGIELVGNQARLRVGFLKNVEIRQGAQLTRRSSSLLGTSVLALEPGPEFMPVIPPGGLISTGFDAADMNVLMGTVNDLSGQVSSILDEFQKTQMALIRAFLESINSIAYRIDERTDEEFERIARILEAVALITERTERMLRYNEGIINASIDETYQTVADIRAITAEIRQGRGNIGQTIYGDDLYNSLLSVTDNAAQAADKLTEALDSINVLVQNVDGVVSNAGEIVDRALGLGIQFDSNASYNFLSQSAQAGASLRLEPASNDRWYRIGVSSVPDGISNRTIRETTDASGIVSLEDTTETTFSFAIDVEIARRIGLFTLRGGLLENTAGIGLDFQAFKWMSLSGEIFNFKAGQVPNLRNTITIYPFFDPDSDMPLNWIYLRGGISNALSGNRDYFLGGGLRFADREIRGLVGLLPAFN